MPESPVREEITVEGYFKVLDRYKELFNENLIVVAHSIGNPMFIKYISKNGLKVGKYISLAGFSKDFFNEVCQAIINFGIIFFFCNTFARIIEFFIDVVSSILNVLCQLFKIY